ncbi:hypothetical protein [Acanthamoeba castellanii mimivirus]|nr:hypothetical protein MIMI_gp0422 [Acanthamoeba polyphaga mimivirus]AHA45472.1 hypothetical protein HIRU_S566 [Hirudovirus strain Sangsue]AHJ40089.1 hypothetical protein [Samba virus]ALR83971.1 hypothetical protein [Niemeyer virus]AMZ02836.1 hypothetical protein [Mimivirus Bombay]BAV61493.1 hypothetical protein [Acanthamoeba castellanii mimivirus]
MEQDYLTIDETINIINLNTVNLTQYIDSKTLLIFDNNILLESKFISLQEIFNLLDFILFDIIDFLVKSVLPKIPIVNYNYRITGNKAYERFVDLDTNKILSPTFDIEIVDSIDKIIDFSKNISTLLNSFINHTFGPFRFFIRNILKKYNLIDEKCYNHYENKLVELFRYGFEKNSGNLYNTVVFLHLTFREDLFEDIRIDNSIEITNSNHNTIYYPIMTIRQSSVQYVPYFNNRIKYARIPYIIKEFLENIICGIDIEKNVENINYLLDINMYVQNPEFYNNGYDDLNTFLEISENTYFGQSFIEDMELSTKIDELYKKNNTNHIVNKIMGLPLETNIIEKIIKKYYDTYQHKFSIDNNHGLTNLYNINPFREITTNNDLLNIIDIVKTTDKKYQTPIREYTGGKHIWINCYCQLINLGLEEHNESTQFIKNPDNIVEIAKNMNHVFNELYFNYQYINIIDNIFKNEFEVISSQTFLYYCDPTGQTNIVDNLNIGIGSVIFIPNHLSTSYGSFKTFKEFISPTKVIYKIKITNYPNKGKNWIFIDTYSRVQEEKEILIRANSYYVIEDIDYVLIEFNHDDFDNVSEPYVVKVIVMRLFDDVTSAVIYSTKLNTVVND